MKDEMKCVYCEEYNNSVSGVRNEIETNLDALKDIAENMTFLRGSELKFGARYYLKWSDGSEWGYNHRCISGGDPVGVRSLGFKKGTFVFYRMPKIQREKYLSQIKKKWDSAIDIAKIKEISKSYKKIKTIERLKEFDEFLEKQLEIWENASEKIYKKFANIKLEKLLKIERSDLGWPF